MEYFFSDIHQYHSPSFVTLCNFATDGQIQQEFSRRLVKIVVYHVLKQLKLVI